MSPGRKQPVIDTRQQLTTRKKAQDKETAEPGGSLSDHVKHLQSSSSAATGIGVKSSHVSATKAQRSAGVTDNSENEGRLGIRIKNELIASPHTTPRGHAELKTQAHVTEPTALESKKAHTDVAVPKAFAAEPAAGKPPARGSSIVEGAPSEPQIGQVGVGMRIQDDPPHKIISLVPGM